MLNADRCDTCGSWQLAERKGYSAERKGQKGKASNAMLYALSAVRLALKGDERWS